MCEPHILGEPTADASGGSLNHDQTPPATGGRSRRE